tara:strand:+ start:278 stop:580 length:303 start_codon:yes stop_codon:yes gene_type:complete
MFQIKAWKNPHNYRYNSVEYWKDRAKFYQYEYLMYITRTTGINNDKEKLEDWIVDNCDEESLLEVNETWNKTDSKVVKFYEMLDGKDSDRLGLLWTNNKI